MLTSFLTSPLPSLKLVSRAVSGFRLFGTIAGEWGVALREESKIIGLHFGSKKTSKTSRIYREIQSFFEPK